MRGDRHGPPRSGIPAEGVRLSAPRHLIPIPPTKSQDDLVRHINQRLRDLQLLINELTGANGSTPRSTPIDMGGARIVNAGRAKVDTDLVTRKDLLDYSGFAPDGEVFTAVKPLVAQGGLRVPKKARMKDEVVTLEDLQDYLALGSAAGGGLTGQFPNPGVGSVAGAMFEADPPTGSRPGTSFTLPAVPNIVLVRHNLLWLRKVGGAPGVNEFSFSGTTLTTGDSIAVGDDLYAVGWL